MQIQWLSTQPRARNVLCNYETSHDFLSGWVWEGNDWIFRFFLVLENDFEFDT